MKTDSTTQLVIQLSTLAYRDEVFESNLRLTVKLSQALYMKYADRRSPQKQNHYCVTTAQPLPIRLKKKTNFML